MLLCAPHLNAVFGHIHQDLDPIFEHIHQDLNPIFGHIHQDLNLKSCLLCLCLPKSTSQPGVLASLNPV